MTPGSSAKSDEATARLIEMIERHPAEELYDTRTDPHEMRNLAAKPAFNGVLARMRARMKQLRVELGDVDE